MAQNKKIEHATGEEAEKAMKKLKSLFSHLFSAQNEIDFNIKSL